MNKIDIELENRMKKYNQEELLKIINSFSEEEKEKIFDQINEINLDNIKKLYDSLSNKNKQSGENITSITALNKDKLSKEKIEEYRKLGEDILYKNQYALVTMSGGQGTRLGFDGPKGTYQIDIEPRPKYLFEILADNLIKINKKYNITVPWYIMTSSENNDKIEQFFKDNRYFNYPEKDIKFFKQGNLPLITVDGKLIINGKKQIKEAADGNGGIFTSMYTTGILEDMKKRNIKWIFIGSIDNVLLKLADPILLGLAIKSNVEIATKSIIKNSPDEKVGVICKQGNKIKVIEYSEMSDEFKNMRNEDNELKFGESHIMCNLFSINALDILKDKELPYHIAFKKSDYINEEGVLVKPEEPNVYKFEKFIFDAWEYFNDIAILRGIREEDFAPVKNRVGVDSPETAIKLYNEYNVKRRENLK